MGIIFFVNSCGGFEFVYKKNKNDFAIKDITKISVEGDDSDKIYLSLRNLIGEGDNNTSVYKLFLSSTKKETAEAIKKDGTASRFAIEFSINYILFNLNKNCEKYNSIINTKNTYIAKSAGYSFVTDFSKTETINQNIVKNINIFLSSLNKLSRIEDCNNQQ